MGHRSNSTAHLKSMNFTQIKQERRRLEFMLKIVCIAELVTSNPPDLVLPGQYQTVAMDRIFKTCNNLKIR